MDVPLRATVYGELTQRSSVKVSGIRDAGNIVEMEGMQFTVPVKQTARLRRRW